MTKGERILELRDRRGIGQTDLAEMVGISKQTLYKYENNIVTNIPSDKIEAIADALNVSPAYLMGWTSDPIIVDESRLLSTFAKLDAADRTDLIKYAEFKLTDEKYRKKSRELA